MKNGFPCNRAKKVSNSISDNTPFCVGGGWAKLSDEPCPPDLGNCSVCDIGVDIDGRDSPVGYGEKAEASMVLRRPFGWLSGSSSGILSGEVGEMGFFSSWSLFSRPSTRFSRASSTSVLGPRFFGMASAETIRWLGSAGRGSTTHHKRRHIGRPCRPRSSVADDYI